MNVVEGLRVLDRGSFIAVPHGAPVLAGSQPR